MSQPRPRPLRAAHDSVLARFPVPYIEFLTDLARIPWPRAREPLLRRVPFLWHLVQVRARLSGTAG